MTSGRRPVAQQLLKDRHRLNDRGEQPALTPRHQAAVFRLIEGQGRPQTTHVVEDALGPLLGGPGEERIATTADHVHRSIDIAEGQTLPPEQPLVRSLEQRAGEQVRVLVEVRAFENVDCSEGAPFGRRRIGIAHDRDIEVGGGFEKGISLRVIEGLEEQRDRLRGAL
jgi:hypothetical protein